MAEEITRLAYDEARAALREQDATLANVRNRATGLLAAAAVGTSFAAGVGLLNTDPARGATFPLWAGWTMFGLITSIGVGVSIVLWPVTRWSFGPHPAALLRHASHDADDTLRRATEAMIVAMASNDRLLTRRMTTYRITVGVLMIDILLLVAALLIREV